MTDWNPKKQMSVWQYVKFKLGYWVQVDTLPQWVKNANEGYYEGYVDKYGCRPYDVEKVYTGDSLKYKVYYRTVSWPGGIKTEYYTRIKP